LAGRFGSPRDIRSDNCKLSIQENARFTRHMVETARAKYQQTQPSKVPRNILRSALYSLSLGPPSTASIVADSLTIIAIDLGCDFSTIVAPDERYVQTRWLQTFLTRC
jgi:hypothetical protein